jgi:hypothetical protein
MHTNRCFHLLSHRVQPSVQRLAQIRIPQCSRRTSALCMSTHNHFLYFEMRNRVLDDTSRIDVIRMHRICNVAVHENIAGLALADSTLRQPRVAAAQPEYLGRLALGEVDEGIGVCGGRVLGVQTI